MKKSSILKITLAILPLFPLSGAYIQGSSLIARDEGGARMEERMERPASGAYAHPGAYQDARAFERGANYGAGSSNGGNVVPPNTNWVAPDTTPGPLPPPSNPYPQNPQ
jgi:hypothetical protein